MDSRSIAVLYFFVIGACFGSFALATAWRIKKGKNFTKERSECEKCHHTLQAKDLVPLLSYLSLKGKCRYCHKKLPWLFPIAELTGAAAFMLSYLYWPIRLTGMLHIAQFLVWCVALVLLLILFFYDLQWFLLPNKIMYPVWGVAAVFWLLQFASKPTLATVINSALAIVVAGGLFLLFYTVSNGKWIGFGDVRLGLAIGLLVRTPLLAGLVLFAASVIGVLCSLPSLLQGKRNLTSKVPFGPLLILGLVFSILFGQRLIDWYMVHILYF